MCSGSWGGTGSAVFSETTEDGVVTRSLDHFEVIREGSLDEDEYDQVVRDITNFLEYIGEPIQPWSAAPWESA